MASICPVDRRTMQLWLHIPVDALRGVSNPCPNLYRCDCGYVSVWPLPTPAQVATFYEMEYYTHSGVAQRRQPDNTFLDRLRIHVAWRFDADRLSPTEWMQKTLGADRRCVCDLGCGGGAHIKALRSAGYEVAGVEPDLRAASKLVTEGLDVHAGTAEELPEQIRNRRFDAVIMSHVLEHCLDPERALDSARSILRPEGMLVCEVPNQDSMARRFAGPTWWHFDVPRHLRFFTGGALSKLIERAGFRVDRIEYARYCAQFSNYTISEERRTRQTLGFGPWNSKPKAWLLLALTAFAPLRLKYDSVRIVAKAA